jgi:uncharacterized protein (TIGR03905 family)
MRSTYKPVGVCARSIDIDVEGGVIRDVSFRDGCSGNLQAVSRLVTGMTAREAIEKLRGIRCGRRTTSCPDQLALALETLTAGAS